MSDQVSGRKKHTVKGGVGMANAVRRILISELSTEAPYKVTFRTNTSSETDEFVAHRIGLVPFRRTGNGDTLTLHADTAGTVWSGALTGVAFEAVHTNIALLVLGEGEQLDLDVHFDRRKASAHARYAPCAAVGMKKQDGTTYSVSFELLDRERDDVRIMHEALDVLQAHVDDALRQLASQPDTPPRSRC